MLAMGNIDTSEQARQIRIPTLVVASDVDEVTPTTASRHLASLIPGARFEIIKDASYIGASSKDPRVMQLVAEFLAEDAR
jgi:3-oxoadipate enol-lactonase